MREVETQGRNVEDEKSLVNKGSIGDVCVEHRGIWIKQKTTQSFQRPVGTKRLGSGPKASFGDRIPVILICSS